MIKRYPSFIKETYQGFPTKSHFIANKAKDSEYVRYLISDYTKDINPNVNVEKAVSTLDDYTQDLIIKMIGDYESNTRSQDEIDVTPITSLTYNESQQIGGKNLFTCFLKVISALGQKDCEIDWQIIPDDYIALFVSDTIPIEDLKGVLSRYLYFDDFFKSKQVTDRFGRLYWGVKTDLTIEYGIYLDRVQNQLGNFSLTIGTYNYVMTQNLKSATNLKKLLVGLDLKKLSIASKVKEVMKDYFPGESDNKTKPRIDGDVISYGFDNLGKWDNNNVDSGELENIKTNLRNHLMQFKWSDQIQFNVIPSNGWIFLNIKIK